MAKRKRTEAPNQNMIQKLISRASLSWRLLTDGRVNMGHKLIPFIALLYVLSPIDFIPEIVFGPIGVIDDMGIFIAALEFFIRMAPADVVRDHQRDLQDNISGMDDQGYGTGHVVDGEYRRKD